MTFCHLAAGGVPAYSARGCMLPTFDKAFVRLSQFHESLIFRGTIVIFSKPLRTHYFAVMQCHGIKRAEAVPAGIGG